MHLLALIKKIEPKDIRRIVGLTIVSGVANSLLIVVVNHVASDVANGEHPGLIVCALFAVAFCAYYFSERFAMMRANKVIEKELKKLRLHTVSLLCESELKRVEDVGQHAISNVLSNETNHLSVAFPVLADGLQQSVLLCVSLAYLAYLSPLALGVFVSVVAIGLLAYRGVSKKYKASLTAAAFNQTQMVQCISDMLDGSKELRLSKKVSASVLQSYRQLSAQTHSLFVEAGQHSADVAVIASAVAYIMLGIVVFVLPGHFMQSHLIIFQLVPMLLFCIGPVIKIVAQYPMFIRAEMGLASIALINGRLGQTNELPTSEIRQAGWLLSGFKRIDYQGITYSYTDESGESSFVSGPWDFSVQRGEIIFLVGGNGSGKSTALRLMTGLYKADAGQIMVDGRVLDSFGFAGLREQFSAIFANFHLFDRLYGLENISDQSVNQLIDDMELTGKVRYKNGQFTDLNLSTGQRKRLALIAAILEDRPIYAFDEWSAEQDVHFREVFYRKILPQLKQKGKTIIAVTHDERYWNVADRIVKFDLGKIQEI